VPASNSILSKVAIINLTYVHTVGDRNTYFCDDVLCVIGADDSNLKQFLSILNLSANHLYRHDDGFIVGSDK